MGSSWRKRFSRCSATCGTPVSGRRRRANCSGSSAGAPGAANRSFGGRGRTASPWSFPIFDGAVGYQLWSFWQEHKEFAIDQFRDEADLADLVFKAKETGALMIGGGVSKHHTIWWNQFRGGLDHAVYITTAPEWDGSLSGARVREGISWGKVKETANQVTIEGDASAILPMMIAAALGRPHR